MLSDFRTPKSRKNIESANKSSTAIILPGISKTIKHSQTQRKPNKISYIETINNISENVEYGDKNTFYLTKQQGKLKDMLRKMNNDTLEMIDTIRPKKNVSKITKEEAVVVTDKQIENSRKNIAIMQNEIEKIQEKYKRVIQQQQEVDVTNKISQIKEEIEELKGENVSMKFTVEKDGKEIVKQYSDGYDSKLNILENDKASFDLKLQRLKEQNTKALEENSKILVKTKEVDAKTETYNEEYQKIISGLYLETLNKNKEMTLRQRKYQLQALKKKLDFQNNHLQYKYYKYLKQLQVKKDVCDGLSSKQTDVFEKIVKSKEEIAALSVVADRLKRERQQKNRSVLMFIEHEIRSKQQDSDFGESRLLPRAISSIQYDKKSPEKAFIQTQLSRKWQSEPFNEISQQAKENELQQSKKQEEGNTTAKQIEEFEQLDTIQAKKQVDKQALGKHQEGKTSSSNLI